MLSIPDVAPGNQAIALSRDPQFAAEALWFGAWSLLRLDHAQLDIADVQLEGALSRAQKALG